MTLQTARKYEEFETLLLKLENQITSEPKIGEVSSDYNSLNKLRQELNGLVGPKTQARLDTLAERIQSIQPKTNTSVTSSQGYLILENISCIGVNSSVFEHYNNLAVAKDIERSPNSEQINFTPDQAIIHFEKKGLFLPSFALSCNILAALFKAGVRRQKNGGWETLDPEAKKILDQYKNHGSGYGWQAQNTIIDFENQNIIQYPTPADFNRQDDFNDSGIRIVSSFEKLTLEDELLETALDKAPKLVYVQQLTGLEDPSILVKIGDYFGMPAKLWFPWSGKRGSNYQEKRAVWLGCYSSNFNLDANNILGNYDAARGVFVSAEGAHKNNSEGITL